MIFLFTERHSPRSIVNVRGFTSILSDATLTVILTSNRGSVDKPATSTLFASPSSTNATNADWFPCRSILASSTSVTRTTTVICFSFDFFKNVESSVSMPCETRNFSLLLSTSSLMAENVIIWTWCQFNAVKKTVCGVTETRGGDITHDVFSKWAIGRIVTFAIGSVSKTTPYVTLKPSSTHNGPMNLTRSSSSLVSASMITSFVSALLIFITWINISLCPASSNCGSSDSSVCTILHV